MNLDAQRKSVLIMANGKTRKQKLTYSQMMRQMSLLFCWATIFIVYFFMGGTFETAAIKELKQKKEH